MENFETLREKWNSLEAGSGSGESSGGWDFMPFSEMIHLVVKETTEGSTTTRAVHFAGAEDTRITAQDLIDAGIFEKPGDLLRDAGAYMNESDYVFGINADGSWKFYAYGGGYEENDFVARGTSLADQIVMTVAQGGTE